jgi:hypothetical protein
MCFKNTTRCSACGDDDVAVVLCDRGKIGIICVEPARKRPSDVWTTKWIAAETSALANFGIAGNLLRDHDDFVHVRVPEVRRGVFSIPVLHDHHRVQACIVDFLRNNVHEGDLCKNCTEGRAKVLAITEAIFENPIPVEKMLEEGYQMVVFGKSVTSPGRLVEGSASKHKTFVIFMNEDGTLAQDKDFRNLMHHLLGDRDDSIVNYALKLKASIYPWLHIESNIVMGINCLIYVGDHTRTVQIGDSDFLNIILRDTSTLKYLHVSSNTKVKYAEARIVDGGPAGDGDLDSAIMERIVVTSDKSFLGSAMHAILNLVGN